jgi:tRNA-splicing ligase RtcB
VISLHAFQKISEFEWEIPAAFRKSMLAPVRVFATRRLLETALDDLALEQAINAACLPGLAGPVIVMPDVHQGYGFPIGGVAVTRLPDGVVSPGAIGYDINCGVRLLASVIDLEEAEPYLDDLASALDRYCPSGVGAKGAWNLSSIELDQVCRQGARWALKKGMGSEEDLQRCEEYGCLEGADPGRVSGRARERGRGQLGTLGAGNHFLEIDVVSQIFDVAAAQAMGLREGCLALQIHCGSRGFGHQVCTDYVQDFQGAVRRFAIQIPDRELVCAPVNSPEGEAYLGAMRAAANFAFANRQILAHQSRLAFEEVLAGKVGNPFLRQVYDVAHNMAKFETHTIAGEQVKVCIHRKGATRAFGPGTPGLPDEYRETGQPVLVPGSMGTSSWVLAGTTESMARSYGSTCHGAGRVLSRSQARKEVRGEKLRDRLEGQGIHVRAGSLPGLAEEAPEAYKDVDQVVETVCGAGIARKVAQLRPVAVVKG